MRFSYLTTCAMIVLGMVTVATADDENHKIIGKVMKEGLKGDESPFGKIKAGAATADDYATLYELSRTLRGTEAPVGEQEGYDAKVEALITATGALAYAGESPERISAVKEASNCKSCHSEHKPD